MTKLWEKIMTKKPQTFPEAMAITTKLIDLDKDLRDTRRKDSAGHSVRKEEKKKLNQQTPPTQVRETEASRKIHPSVIPFSLSR